MALSTRTRMMAAAARPCKLIKRTPLLTHSLRLSTADGPSENARSKTRGKSKVSTLFGALLVLGIGTTAYGLYDFYGTLTQWPETIRGDLRAGIKAKQQDDFKLASRYLERAYDTSHSIPELSHIQRSGIAVSLADVLEKDGRPEEAYATLEDAWARIASPGTSASVSNSEHSSNNTASPSVSSAAKSAIEVKPATDRETRMRAVALAHKLGDLSEMHSLPPAIEERWRSWAATEVLRLTRSPSTESSPSVPSKSVHGDSAHTGLGLPSWANETDIGAPLHALGAFYARVGRIEYAVPLYLQAISILLPPSSGQGVLGKGPGVEEKCRAAQLMADLSALLANAAPPPSSSAPSPSSATPTHEQAESWALRALGVLQGATGVRLPGFDVLPSRPNPGEGGGNDANVLPALQGAAAACEACSVALVVVLFNLGMLKEASSDFAAARLLFTHARTAAQRAGGEMGDVAHEASVALKRIGRLERVRGLQSTP